MPPKKEPCRNFQRGSCQYGDRCKFLHVTQQQSKPTAFGFGTPTGSQFQRSSSQQQKPNPFGFGVQNNSQPRQANDFGSKQNQFKPFENKWTRFSPLNNGGSNASQQPENQPSATNHKCTDSESCKRQIIEDLENERPLWKLTCYGHGRNAPCDIVGDISYEELRASAYDDAKRGLNLQSIVERERNLLNSKLVEFESLVRNPYAVPLNSAIAMQNSFPGPTPNVPPTTAQNSTPPSVSSFSQLGASLNVGFGMRPAAPQTNNAFGQPNPFQTFSQNSNNAFGQLNPFQTSSQSSSAFGANNMLFGSAGALASQRPTQSVGASFLPNTASFGSSAASTERNPFSTLAVSPQIPSFASNESVLLPNGSSSNATVQSNMDNMPGGSDSVDNHIWMKEEWKLGEVKHPVDATYLESGYLVYFCEKMDASDFIPHQAILSSTLVRWQSDSLYALKYILSASIFLQD